MAEREAAFVCFAAAVLGGTALIQQGVLWWRPLALIVLATWIVGAVLFRRHRVARLCWTSAVSLCGALGRHDPDRRPGRPRRSGRSRRGVAGLAGAPFAYNVRRSANSAGPRY